MWWHVTFCLLLLCYTCRALHPLPLCALVLTLVHDALHAHAHAHTHVQGHAQEWLGLRVTGSCTAQRRADNSAMPQLYLLHEAALGYALFKGEEFEDIGANLDTVQVGRSVYAIPLHVSRQLVALHEALCMCVPMACGRREVCGHQGKPWARKRMTC